MKRGVNWLQLLVVITVILIATLSVIETNLLSESFTGDNDGKIRFEIVKPPINKHTDAVTTDDNG